MEHKLNQRRALFRQRAVAVMKPYQQQAVRLRLVLGCCPCGVLLSSALALVVCVAYFDLIREYLWSSGGALLVLNPAARRPLPHLNADHLPLNNNVIPPQEPIPPPSPTTNTDSSTSPARIPFNSTAPSPIIRSHPDVNYSSHIIINPTSSSLPNASGPLSKKQQPPTTDSNLAERVTSPAQEIQQCDLFAGRWMRDDSYPLYESQDCPFLDPGFRCQENGRPDVGYMKWRWQPTGCDLPRLDAKAMLERLRGSRVVFVGDSIGRNQWESMLCMLAGGAPNKDRIREVNGQPITKHTGFLSFLFEDHNLTVEYYRSPFLVPQTRPPSHSPRNVSCVLRVDSMDWTSPHWADADVLIFNTGHWWSYEKIMRGGCYFQVGSGVNTSMGVKAGFKRAIRTWREWVAHKVNLAKTMVFFRTYAPAHFSGGTWKTGGTCHQVTEPFSTGGPPFEEEEELEKPWTNPVVAREVGRVGRKGRVRLLDITHLSNYRRDAHSSIYHVSSDEPRPMHRQDCSHWCLPGLPDTWNELLFASLLQGQSQLATPPARLE